ncbi:MAG: phosphate ABC transporter permease PstC, partial [Caldimonas sp.]
MVGSAAKGRPPAPRRAASWPDTLFSVLAHAAALLTLGLLAAIIVALCIGAAPAIREYGLSFLTRSEWDPVQNRYGGLVMIYGTLMTSAIALLIA